MSKERKSKLELTWIGKENRPKLEPRILLEETEKSYHAAKRVSKNNLDVVSIKFYFNNLLVKSVRLGQRL